FLGSSEALTSSIGAEKTALTNFGGYRPDDSGRPHFDAMEFGRNAGTRLKSQTAPSVGDRDVYVSDNAIGSLNLQHFPLQNSSDPAPRSTGPSPYAHLPHNSISCVPQRPTHSAHPSF